MLSATLDETHHVLTSHVESRDGEVLPAPAISIHGELPRFDVGWLCSVCGRNTIRSFHVSTLVYRDSAA